MSIDLTRCESAARELLRLAGWELALHCEPTTILGALEARVCPRAPRLCRASALVEPLRVHEPGHSAPKVATSALGHELGHIGLHLTGAPWPHDEAEATLVGAMVQMPRTATLQVVKSVGLNPTVLIREWPMMLPSEICTRVALASGGAALFYEGRGDRPRVIVGDVPLAKEFVAYALASVVRQTGGPANDDAHGVCASVFEEPARRGVRHGVVVLVDRSK